MGNKSELFHQSEINKTEITRLAVSYMLKITRVGFYCWQLNTLTNPRRLMEGPVGMKMACARADEKG